MNISTPMPLAGHDPNLQKETVKELLISTPMPLAGHDDVLIIDDFGTENFYSHAPRGA